MNYLSKTASLSTIHLSIEQKIRDNKPPKKYTPTLWQTYVLKLGLSWPTFLARRFHKALILTQTAFGLIFKFTLVAIAYAIATSPLLLAAFLILRYFRSLII